MADDRRPPRAVELVLVAILCAAIALVVRFSRYRLDFAFDDRYLQAQIGLVETGCVSLPAYVLQTFSQHFSPAWRAIAYLEWRFTGLVAWPAHLVAEAGHLISAVLLFAVLRRYTGPLAALVAASLWAAAAAGQWDSILSNVSGLHISGALAALLAAMLSLSHARDERSGAWPFVLPAAIVVAALFWGFSVLLLPALVLQAWLLERPAAGRPLGRRWWIPGTGAAVLMTAIVGLFSAADIAASAAPQPDPVAAVARSAAIAASALAQLTWMTSLAGGDRYLPFKILVAALALVSLFLLPRGERRAALVFFALAEGYLLLATIGRSNLPRADMMQSGRYLYFPTLAWCVLAGLLAQQVFAAASNVPRGVMAAVLLLLGLYVVVHARRVADTGAARYETEWGPTSQGFADNLAVVEGLVRRAKADGKRIAVPDIPIHVPPVTRMYYPLSAFVAVADPQADRWLDFRKPDEVADDDRARFAALLSSIDSPVAANWAQLSDLATRELAALSWLNQWAARRGTIVRIPNFAFRYGVLELPVAQLRALAFGEQLASISIVPWSAWTAAEAQELATQLSREPDPTARWWVARLAQETASRPRP